MTSLLRELKRRPPGCSFEVTYEVTHHGPYLETPTLFIEIGSSEATWGDRDAARAIARALTEVRVTECPGPWASGAATMPRGSPRSA